MKTASTARVSSQGAGRNAVPVDGSDVVADGVEFDHPVPAGAEGGGDGRAAFEADFTFGGGAAGEDGDGPTGAAVEIGHGSVLATGIARTGASDARDSGRPAQPALLSQGRD
jgi:hypothetical protein